MNRFNHIFRVALLAIFFAAHVRAGFVHPGLLHAKDDLVRIKNMVAQGVEPVKSGFEVFTADLASKLDYSMRGPGQEIGRNPNINFREFDSDANASYQLALMWAITGENAYADKSINIINAWSGSLNRVSGRDAVLMGGLGPFKMINAAEILRYTKTGWSEEDIKQCEDMFLNVIYPIIKDFAPFANGNWDAAVIQTVMAIGVFCNDQDIFEQGLRYYVNGVGNGCLTHYIIDKSGQCQESGRDQQHTQLGLALLAACCEIAWQQGLDLYAYEDYLLLKGFEYTAKYNLGDDVPFSETIDRTGKYHHMQISTKGRGQLRAVYEMVFNHYVNRVQMEAPFTQKAAEKVRPEGPGTPGADHPGFGTLLFSRQVEQQNSVDIHPASPGGLIASGLTNQIELKWITSIAAANYTVKRAVIPEGPYEIIAENIGLTEYKDSKVKSGVVYYYKVLANNSAGISDDSYQASVCAGLPNGWMQADIGEVEIVGSTDFDGQTFTLTASGIDIGFAGEQQNFTYIQIDGDSVITVRFVPQLSSQFTHFGLLMRQSLYPHAAQVAVLITPQFDLDIEEPGWFARLMSRPTDGGESFVKASKQLASPIISHYRLTGYCWMRLERKGDTFTASVSPDGRNWIEVGNKSVVLEDKLFVGPAVCSGVTNVTTMVKFDQVEVRSNFLESQ